MTLVTKEEAEILRKEIKNVTIITTCVQRSSRGKRYVEETNAVIELLNKLRNN